MPKQIKVVIILLVLILIVFLAARRYQRTEAERGVYTGTIEAEESRVGSTVGGRVEKKLVREGEIVEKGEPLIFFESDELKASLDAALAAERQSEARLRDLEAGPRAEEIERARAVVAQAQSQLDKLRAGSRLEEIAAAKAVMEQARERLALLEKGARQEDRDRAKQELEAAKADRILADRTFQRAEGLYKEGAISAQNLDEASTRIESAAAREEAAKRGLDELLAGSRPEEIRAGQKALAQAQANLELVMKGPRPEDVRAAEESVRQAKATLAELKAGARPQQIEQARNALQQAKANVRQIRARLRERAVFASKPGQLQAINVQVGDLVTPGQSIGIIIDPTDLYLRIYVAEEDLGELKVGTKLPIVTDSGVRTEGIVEQIPMRAEFTPRNVQTKEERALQVYAVKIRVPNPEGRLRAGASADVLLR